MIHGQGSLPCSTAASSLRRLATANKLSDYVRSSAEVLYSASMLTDKYSLVSQVFIGGVFVADVVEDAHNLCSLNYQDTNPSYSHFECVSLVLCVAEIGLRCRDMRSQYDQKNWIAFSTLGYYVVRNLIRIFPFAASKIVGVWIVFTTTLKESSKGNLDREGSTFMNQSPLRSSDARSGTRDKFSQNSPSRSQDQSTTQQLAVIPNAASPAPSRWFSFSSLEGAASAAGTKAKNFFAAIPSTFSALATSINQPPPMSYADACRLTGASAESPNLEEILKNYKIVLLRIKKGIEKPGASSFVQQQLSDQFSSYHQACLVIFQTQQWDIDLLRV